jgi:hypothetical protein
VFALDGDVFSFEVASLHKFREFFGKWCLWCDGVGSNYLNTAEFSSLSGSLIAIQQSNIGFVDSLYQIQTFLHYTMVIAFTGHT